MPLAADLRLQRAPLNRSGDLIVIIIDPKRREEQQIPAASRETVRLSFQKFNPYIGSPPSTSTCPPVRLPHSEIVNPLGNGKNQRNNTNNEGNCCVVHL